MPAVPRYDARHYRIHVNGNHKRQGFSGGQGGILFFSETLHSPAVLRIERRGMTASEHIIVAPRQQAGHDHAEEHGIIPQPFHQHACQKAAQRNTEIEGHKNVELAAPRRSGATACIAMVCKEGWIAPKLYPNRTADNR